METVSSLLAFVRGIHRSPVVPLRKGPVTPLWRHSNETQIYVYVPPTIFQFIKDHNLYETMAPGALLLSWINCNPSMDK